MLVPSQLLHDVLYKPTPPSLHKHFKRPSHSHAEVKHVRCEEGAAVFREHRIPKPKPCGQTHSLRVSIAFRGLDRLSAMSSLAFVSMSGVSVERAKEPSASLSATQSTAGGNWIFRNTDSGTCTTSNSRINKSRLEYRLQSMRNLQWPQVTLGTLAFILSSLNSATDMPAMRDAT